MNLSPSEDALGGATVHAAPAAHEPGARGRHRTPPAAALAAALAVVQLIVLIAFSWPAARMAPHGVPVVVAGPPAAVSDLTHRLEQRAPDSFDFTTRGDEASARRALLDRDAYAAITVQPTGGTKVLVSSAASAAVAGAFTQLAGELSHSSGATVPVDDVRPAPAKDPHGAAFASSVLPIVLTGMIGGVVFALKITRRRSKFAAVALFAAFAGLASTAVAHGWIGALDGNYFAEASVVALTVLAICATVMGLGTALGGPGIALGIVTILLVGNPFSGVASAPQMLPAPFGTLGQLLPPGAGASLLRSVSFFDGAAAAQPLTVLAVWAAAGLALTAVRRRAGSAEPAPSPAAGGAASA
ncbi:ABC transporter permease [Streptomyces echinatus]|uniref:ABC transporter permease n=1 Tax=Streptomyces echinatus TaxID=67293 RepID=UPI0037BC2D4A